MREYDSSHMVRINHISQQESPQASIHEEPPNLCMHYQWFFRVSYYVHAKESAKDLEIEWALDVQGKAPGIECHPTWASTFIWSNDSATSHDRFTPNGRVVGEPCLKWPYFGEIQVGEIL